MKGKKVFTESRHEPSKGNTEEGGKVKTDRESDCRAETHINGGASEICAQRERFWKLRETETSQNVPLETLIWGPLRYCQTMVMRWMLMNPQMKPQK